jgi:hypothetical protein
MLHVCDEVDAMRELARPLPRLSTEGAVILGNTKKSIKEFYDTVQKWCSLGTGEPEYENAFTAILARKDEVDINLNLCRKSNLLREEEKRAVVSLERCTKTACSIYNIETNKFSDEDECTLKDWGEMFFSKKLVDILSKMKFSMAGDVLVPTVQKSVMSTSPLPQDSLKDESFAPVEQSSQFPAFELKKDDKKQEKKRSAQAHLRKTLKKK